MLSSKKSPRRSNLFRSRFLAAGKDAATIRDVRRLREYLAGQIIMAALQVGFLIALALFARAVLVLFERHGDSLNPLYLRMSLGGIVVCFLLVARRLFLRGREIVEVRADLATASRKLEALREDLLRKPDDRT
jgi:hypothetical protein